MKEKIRNFFKDRYGGDELNIFLMSLSIILILVGNILKKELIIVVAYIPLIYSFIRIMSKDIYKRQAENQRFKKSIVPIEKKVSILKRKFKDRKEYKYFKCPSCGTYIRIPRRKGRVNIRCPKCNTKFEART